MIAVICTCTQLLILYNILFLSFIVCPIAIPYSMGQIINVVSLYHIVCLSVCTLTVTFLDQYFAKSGTEVTIPTSAQQ